MQDFKALKARWRGGEEAWATPKIVLTASPLKGSFGLLLATSIGVFVLLTSTWGSGVVKWLLGVVSYLAALSSPLKAAAGLAAGGFNGVVGFFSDIFSAIGIKPDKVNHKLLGQASVVGLSIFLIQGIIAAAYKAPMEWLENVRKLVVVTPVSALAEGCLLSGALCWLACLHGASENLPLRLLEPSALPSAGYGVACLPMSSTGMKSCILPSKYARC